MSAPSRSDHVGTDPSTIEIARTLSAYGVQRTYPKHAVIITEGDMSDSIYVIQSGRVKVYLTEEHGKEVIIDIHGPGSFVGEMAFDELPRSASAMTMESSTLTVVPQSRFREFLQQQPDAALKLVRHLIRRARAATESIRSLALLDVYGRVARLLLDLAEPRDGQLVVLQALTQQDIAHRVGCSREMVSRLFKDLVVGGYIAVRGRQIFIQRDLPEHW